MKVQVTQSHIDKGVQASCYNCPISQSLLENNKELNEVIVKQGSVEMYWKNDGYSFYHLPESAMNFIRDFDAGEKVNPFEFELNIK